MDRGAWQARVHRVAKNQAGLSTHARTHYYFTRRKAGAIIAISRNTGVAKLGITFKKEDRVNK